MTDWKRKLAAYLHDPPEKAYDFGPWHKDRAEHYARRMDVSGDLWTEHSPDHTAAAADRMIFPDPSNAPGLGQGVRLRHSLTGNVLGLSWPEGKDEAAAILDDGFPDYDGELTDQERFFLLWRCWLPGAASQEGGGSIPFLPADTRIPDGTIWNHNSVVSALEGTRDPEGKLAPALLLFQIGPVQEFIAQARSTRDLWSGSYLLSWLVAHGLKRLSDKIGPDAVIFPSLRGQALFDWLHRDLLDRAHFRQGNSASRSFWQVLGLKKRQSDALIPNLPNRFLAIVPSDFDAGIVEKAIRDEWNEISESCFEFLNLDRAKREAWDFQCNAFLQFSWSLQPWSEPSFVIGECGKTGSLVAGLLESLRECADAVPDKDTRCYPLNRGVFWSGHFDLTSHRLDARRTCRNFAAWEPKCVARDRDAFSGREEALIGREWLNGALKDPALRYLFRSQDKLGAISLIKRVWHVACLEKKGLKRRNVSFDSVHAVAAGKWKAKLAERIMSHEDGPDLAGIFSDFATIARSAAVALKETMNVPELDETSERDAVRKWLDGLDAILLRPDAWETTEENATKSEKKQAEQAAKLLRELGNKKLTNSSSLGLPPSYYAVIAMDGDKIGEWLSGANNPKIRDLLSGKAARYFDGFEKGKTWLDCHRPLSPSYHLGFSEALSNFALHVVSRVVEAHHGQMIYAGGDDVLAMVPAEEAVACARGLRSAFRGERALSERYSDKFFPAPSDGLIVLNTGSSEGLPSWPLIVPAGMTVSAGIAIGHVKAPLQDMVEEARESEKRAKKCRTLGGFGRNALAVSLFKRSGEIIQWGAGFGSAGLLLLEQFQRLSRSESVPSKFGHRIPELLRRFDVFGGATCTEEMKPIIEAEVRWAWDQIKGGDKVARRQAREEFFQTAGMYLDELVREEGAIKEFSDLFAVETFIKRQAIQS